MIGATFGRDARITRQRDYLAVKDRGRRFYTDFFIVQSKPSDLGVSRLGITAGRKVGKAVRRNRIKRLIREFFRQNRHIFREPTDVVVVVRSGKPLPTYQEVAKELKLALGCKC